jgi:hypothetical protein
MARRLEYALLFGLGLVLILLGLAILLRTGIWRYI